MNEVIIYRTQDKQTEVEVQFDGETVWLTQMQMATLFNQTKQNISLHLNIKESLTVKKEGKTFWET